jgi:hypothetical protein
MAGRRFQLSLVVRGEQRACRRGRCGSDLLEQVCLNDFEDAIVSQPLKGLESQPSHERQEDTLRELEAL